MVLQKALQRQHAALSGRSAAHLERVPESNPAFESCGPLDLARGCMQQ